jgi:hypothetical protein
MILTDGKRLATTEGVDGLHKMAQRVGLNRGWFNKEATPPCYSIPSQIYHSRAIQLGAIHMPSKQLDKRVRKGGD